MYRLGIVSLLILFANPVLGVGTEPSASQGSGQDKNPSATAQQPPPPVLPGVHADPAIAVFGDTYYLYPTTDGTAGWMSTFFRCWSSKDLKNWKNEGVVLDLPKALSWAETRAWAPAIAFKNGKYYLYYSANRCVGVAVGDSPTGPFKDPLGRPLVARGQYKCQSIDPMVLVDEDGSAYLYFGQGRCNVVRLNDDMISFPADQVRGITPPGYDGSPFVLKRKGVYYLLWSEFDTHTPRCSTAYATSHSPMGPFRKTPDNPILKGQGEVRGVGHPSVIQIPGTDQWVIAYHRFRIPDGNGHNREICLSPMRFDDQGRILPVDLFEPVIPLP